MKNGKEDGRSQLALFDADAQGGIDVVLADYRGHETMTLDDLFGGFDHMRAITYSYGLGLVEELAERFQDTELILGSRRVVHADIIDVAAHQQIEMRALSGHRRLAEMVKDGTVRIWFNTRKMSHQKVFVLWSDTGRARVITGSANLSRAALTGGQWENVHVMDGSAGAAHYEEVFERLRDDSTATPLEPARMAAFERAGDDWEAQLQEVPLASGSAKATLYLVDDEGGEGDDDADFRYTYDLRDLPKEEREALRKASQERASYVQLQGMRAVTVGEVRRVFRVARNEAAKGRAAVAAFPSFSYDSKAGALRLCGECYARRGEGDWKEDAKRLAEVMEGYEMFVGDSSAAKRNAFKVASFMFAAPWLRPLRHEAETAGYDTAPFPVFCIVYGRSNGGKTTLVKSLLAAMYGRRADSAEIPNDRWTKTRVAAMDGMCHHMALFLNDIPGDRFGRAAREVIKDDAAVGKTDDGPVYVLAVNDLTGLGEGIAKRSVPIRMEQAIGTKEGAEGRKRLTDAMGGMTPALYAEYLSRVWAAVARAKEAIARSAGLDEVDPLAISSRVLDGLLTEAGVVGDWHSPFSYSEVVGDEPMAKEAKAYLSEAYEVNPSQFALRGRTGKATFTPEAPQNDLGTSRLLKELMVELPPELEARRIGRSIVFGDAHKLADFVGASWTGLVARMRHARGIL